MPIVLDEKNETMQTMQKNERSRRPFVFYAALALVLIVLAQMLSQLAFMHHDRVGFFLLSPFKNFYFAFSLPLPPALSFSAYALVLGFASWYIARHHSKFSGLTNFGWTLIYAGALSNIGERIFLGYVRDYWYVFSGIFNTADIYIIIGIVIILFAKNV